MELYRERSERWALSSLGCVPLDWNHEFSTLPAPVDVILDVGFGGGEALVALAAQRPNEAVVGVEVHTPGVAHVLEAIETNGWKHVRVVEADVLEFLPRIPLDSLAGVRMFFPDPWPKSKQRNRRLARQEVVEDLVCLLRVGGTLHIATDVARYAAQVQEVCELHPGLRGGVVARPEWRPVTRFETRGLAEGREPIDLIYERIS
jgi:tRNA (guanine-N7-)-methyltransferase